jgi:hypothetical protein
VRHPGNVARFALALCAGVVTVAGSGAAASAETVRVHLPTEADAIAFATGAEGILNGSKGVETRLPGRVSDAELVTVGVDTTGRPARVGVVQRLVIHGLGDFQFKVPGPARRLDALPESENLPGLRKGAILWQGFSSGRKTLAAKAELFPDLERSRLPISASLSITVGGHPLEPGERLSGPLEMRLTLRNVSAIPVTVPDARGDPRELAPLLDGMAATLADGRRPAPGDGLPTEVGAENLGPAHQEDIESAFAVRGVLRFEEASVGGLAARGGRVAGNEVRFEAQLGGGAPLATTVTVTGSARRAGLPELAVTATTAAPLASVVRPEGGGTWAARLGSPPSPDGKDMLHRALVTLWQVARERQYDAYLGNPDPTGVAATTYRFVLVRTVPRSGPGPVATAGGVTPLGALLFALLLLGLLGGGVVAWSRA